MATEAIEGFTTRQLQVVGLVAAGYSNAEIGQRLGLSARTAKAHCDVLRRKLGVARRRQIPVAFRLRTGRDPLPEPHELQALLPPAPVGGWGDPIPRRLADPIAFWSPYSAG